MAPLGTTIVIAALLCPLCLAESLQDETSLLQVATKALAGKNSPDEADVEGTATYKYWEKLLALQAEAEKEEDEIEDGEEEDFEDPETIMEENDLDKDGKLSLKEAQGDGTQAEVAAITKAFKASDADGDDHMSLEEIPAFLSSFGSKASEETTELGDPKEQVVKVHDPKSSPRSLQGVPNKDHKPTETMSMGALPEVLRRAADEDKKLITAAKKSTAQDKPAKEDKGKQEVKKNAKPADKKSVNTMPATKKGKSAHMKVRDSDSANAPKEAQTMKADNSKKADGKADAAPATAKKAHKKAYVAPAASAVAAAAPTASVAADAAPPASVAAASAEMSLSLQKEMSELTGKETDAMQKEKAYQSKAHAAQKTAREATDVAMKAMKKAESATAAAEAWQDAAHAQLEQVDIAEKASAAAQSVQTAKKDALKAVMDLQKKVSKEKIAKAAMVTTVSAATDKEHTALEALGEMQSNNPAKEKMQQQKKVHHQKKEKVLVALEVSEDERRP